MYLIVAVAIVLLNLYVGLGPGFRVPCFVCSIRVFSLMFRKNVIQNT